MLFLMLGYKVLNSLNIYLSYKIKIIYIYNIFNFLITNAFFNRLGSIVMAL